MREAYTSVSWRPRRSCQVVAPVAEEIDESLIGGPELVELFAAVAPEQSHDHMIGASIQHPPQAAGVLPPLQRLDEIGHLAIVRCQGPKSPVPGRGGLAGIGKQCWTEPVNAAWAVAVAAVFTWLGMVAAISFLEAPLKFLAPGVTLQVGLGIGRLVFRALNICESVLGLVIIAALFVDAPSTAVVIAFLTAVMALLVQVVAVRPVLAVRSNAVLTGTAESGSRRSRAHYVYVGLEVVKVIALVIAGVLLLTV